MVGGVGTSGQTRRGYSRHSPASYRASNKRGGQVFRLDPAKIWAAPEAQVSIGVAMSGASSIERFAPLYQHMIAVEPDQEPGEWLGSRATRRRDGWVTQDRPDPDQLGVRQGGSSHASPRAFSAVGRSRPARPPRRRLTRPVSSFGRVTSRVIPTDSDSGWLRPRCGV
jgi:hypothetical protein